MKGKRNWLGQSKDGDYDTVYFHVYINTSGSHVFFFFLLQFLKIKILLKLEVTAQHMAYSLWKDCKSDVEFSTLDFLFNPGSTFICFYTLKVEHTVFSLRSRCSMNSLRLAFR